MAALERKSNNIGIYIKCHGEFFLISKVGDAPEFAFITPPPNVIITKKNLGGYGCPSYQPDRHPSHTSELIALSLTQNMQMGFTQEEYALCDVGVRDTQGILVDSHGDVIDRTNTCQEFQGLPQWIVKIYTKSKSGEGKITFAFKDKTCDLFDISLEDFYSLFEIDTKRINENLHRKIKLGFKERDDKYISTSFLFNILYLFSLQYGGTNVRILDESCNVVIDKSHPKPYTHLRRGLVTNEYGAYPLEVLKEQPTNIGYGGTRRKKYKKKKHKKTKHVK